MWTKEELRKVLKKEPVNVVFEKVNGDIRDMYCTLNPNLLPEEKEPSSKTKKPENENVLSVWDLEKKAWRSFRVANVTEVYEPEEV